MHVTRVLDIGETSCSGELSSTNWKTFCCWVAGIASQILTYVGTEKAIHAVVARAGVVPVSEMFPDPDASLLGYRFNASGDGARMVLEALLFDPDILVTHLFVFSGSRMVAEMQTDDGRNFLILHMTVLEEASLLATFGSLGENVQLCEEWRAAIEILVDPGEKWRPLGA